MNATRVRDLFGRIGQSARSWRTGLAGDVSSLVGATLIAQALNVGNILLQARLYSPAEVGVFVIILAVHMVMSTFCTLRFDGAIVMARTSGEGGRLALLCGGILLLNTAIAGGILAVALGAGWLDHAGAVIALPFLFFLNGSLQIAQQWCALRGQLKRVALSTAAAPLGIAVGQVALALAHVPYGLVWGYLIGQAVAVAFLLGPLREALALGFGRIASRNALRMLFGLAVRFRRFAFYALPVAMVYFLLPQLAPLIIGATISAAAAGYFGMAFRTTYTPFALLPSALRQALARPLATAVYKGEQGRWRVVLDLCILWIGLVQAIATAVLVLAGPELLAFVLGEQWRPAGAIAGVVAIGASAQALASLVDRVFDITNRQRTSLLLSCAGVALFGVAMPMAVSLGGLTLAISAWSAASVLFGGLWICGAYLALGFPIRSAAKVVGAVAVINVLAIGSVRVGEMIAGLWGGAAASQPLPIATLILASGAMAGLLALTTVRARRRYYSDAPPDFRKAIV